ncbi:secretion protein HlyD [Pseudomonas cichorii]|uniref:efflux RND transporter periplasmic adaptor subunit n=1 Tax=Pseudomonas cichorii TaxID=36746 RepID=UPI001A01F860|nr:efflux RND transporter periplasmic adaptor subunit [Pseudomonas cichorii]GFM80131.1 secretion protein HlyD [Pseudomonas cichorii]
MTGVVRQQQRAALAFESSGRLMSLSVDVGALVQKGQVLAKLDDEPARLRLKQAQASVATSLAQALERKRNYQRQQSLFASGSVAQSVVEQAETAWQDASAQQRRAAADLALAQREAERVRLIAPFTGRVVARQVEPFGEVAAGQVVFEIESDGKTQIVAAVPVAQALKMAPGERATAWVASQSTLALDLVLENLSLRADNGLTQTGIFRVENAGEPVPSGVSVVVQLTPDSSRSMTIPMQALVVGDKYSKARVFVYQPAQGKVSARNISLKGVWQGRAVIDSGLAEGEQIVVSGVAFLTDGQAVSLFQSSTRLTRN